MNKRTFIRNWIARKSNFPTDGLVMYAPLDRYSLTARTGQVFSNPPPGEAYTKHNGVPCCRVVGEASTKVEFIYGDEFTLSTWSCANNVITAVLGYYINYSNCFYVSSQRSRKYFLDVNYSIVFSDLTPDGMWHNFLVTYKNGLAKLHIDGILVGEVKGTVKVSSGTCVVVPIIDDLKDNGNFVAGSRAYSRELSCDEIQSLASEFLNH